MTEIVKKEVKYKDFEFFVTSKDIVPGTNNSKLRYSFNTEINFKDSKISFKSLSMAFCWFNIRKGINDTLYYKFMNSAGEIGDTVYKIEIMPGGYTVNDLNEYVLSVMYENKHYWINGSNKYIYPFEILSNSVAYALEIHINPVPANNTGYTKPAGAEWNFNTSTSLTSQVILSSTSKLNEWLGFDNGTYPEAVDSVRKMYRSVRSPIVQPYSNLMLRANMINMGALSPISDLFAIIDSARFEYLQRIVIESKYESFVEIQNGTYNAFEFTIRDLDNREIEIIDPDIVIVVKVRMPT
jgi:hypothetical protein